MRRNPDNKRVWSPKEKALATLWTFILGVTMVACGGGDRNTNNNNTPDPVAHPTPSLVEGGSTPEPIETETPSSTEAQVVVTPAPAPVPEAVTPAP